VHAGKKKTRPPPKNSTKKKKLRKFEKNEDFLFDKKKFTPSYGRQVHPALLSAYLLAQLVLAKAKLNNSLHPPTYRYNCGATKDVLLISL
jgi:hypothetical protein